MKHPRRARFERRTIEELEIGDERSFRHVALYADLKEVLRRARYPFRVLPRRHAARADLALLLNLTFWSADAGGDVLVDRRIEADVVAHAAWHHLAARAFAGSSSGRPSASALFLGEAIASAFDVYLVGRILGHAPRSTFLATQVPAMADATQAAGLSRKGFEKLLEDLVADPDRAFAELRALLYDAASALFACRGAEPAYHALEALGSRYSCLLPRYELSNWVLYARAYGDADGTDGQARRVDRLLRADGSALDWLQTHWIEPTLRERSSHLARRSRSTRPSASDRPESIR